MAHNRGKVKLTSQAFLADDAALVSRGNDGMLHDARDQAYNQAMKLFYKGTMGMAPPRGSIHGVVVVVPQIAREHGWSPVYVGRTVQAFVVMFTCYILQAVFIRELHRIDAIKDACCQCRPNDCLSAGMSYTGPSYYLGVDWHLCKTPNLPNIAQKVCLSAFVLAMFMDLRETYDIAKCLFRIPSTAGTWVSVKFQTEQSIQRNGPDIDRKESATLGYAVNGMDTAWKCVNWIAVVMPKAIIFVTMLVKGSTYLSNERNRSELIMNAVALIFIIDLPKLVFYTCTTGDLRERMDNLEAWLPDPDDAYTDTESEDDHNSSDGSFFEVAAAFGFPVWLLLTVAAFSFYLEWVCDHALPVPVLSPSELNQTCAMCPAD